MAMFVCTAYMIDTYRLMLIYTNNNIRLTVINTIYYVGMKKIYYIFVIQCTVFIKFIPFMDMRNLEYSYSVA